MGKEFEKCHKKISIKFRKGQYKAIMDLAKAFKMTPAQTTVSLAMIGAVGWLVCGHPKLPLKDYLIPHKEKAQANG